MTEQLRFIHNCPLESNEISLIVCNKMKWRKWLYFLERAFWAITFSSRCLLCRWRPGHDLHLHIPTYLSVSDLLISGDFLQKQTLTAFTDKIIWQYLVKGLGARLLKLLWEWGVARPLTRPSTLKLQVSQERKQSEIWGPSPHETHLHFAVHAVNTDHNRLEMWLKDALENSYYVHFLSGYSQR